MSAEQERGPFRERLIVVASVAADDMGHPNREFQMAKRTDSKRELIDTGTDKRYVRRDDKGQFKESDDQGKSLAQDVKRKAKTKVKSGQGDRGDR